MAELNLDRQREILWEQGREIVAKASCMFVEVDVEADGIAGHGSMLSIGAQSITGNNFYSEVRPSMSVYIPDQREFCEKIGLQRDRLIAEAPSPQQVMDRFNEWLKKEAEITGKKPVFSAHNAGFDWAFYDLYRYQAGHDPSIFGIAPFDLKSLAIAVTGDWDWTQTTTSKMPRVIVPGEPFVHHALKDAQWQQKVHFGLAAILGGNKYEEITSIK